MFDSNVNTGKQSAEHAYKPGYLLPVFSGSDLLAGSLQQNLISKLQSILKIDESDYKRFYEPLILNFATMVQVVPSTFTAPLGSLRNEGLVRAINAVYLLRKDHKHDVDRVQLYGVFSAALLFELHKMLTLYRFVICDREGVYTADWDPLLGPITDMPGAKYYKIRPINNDGFQVNE